MTDGEIDRVFDEIDGLLLREKYACVDAVLRHANVEALHADLLLTLLTATLPAKGRLRERAAFFKRVRGVLSGEVLEGLE